MALGKNYLRELFNKEVEDCYRRIDARMLENYDPTYGNTRATLSPSPKPEVVQLLLAKYRSIGWVVEIREDTLGGQTRTIFCFS